MFQAIHILSCQADSLIIEHAEPWNDSQAQLLTFCDCHYLHSALLKGVFVLFLPFLSKCIFHKFSTGRVKSSSEVKRFKSRELKSFNLLREAAI